METDAKGQLGGLDTSEAERKRCAESSGSWKCGVCGKSNAEVLRECEDAVRRKEEVAGKGSVAEEKVPEGLVIGSREDLGLKSTTARNSSETEAELAEGFVRTTPVVESAYPAARPVQGVPRPTGSQTSPSAQQSPPQSTINQVPATARRAQYKSTFQQKGYHYG